MPSPALPSLASPSSYPVATCSAAAPDASLTRHVVRYYVQQFTQLLTATRENDCFLSVFLPMAFEYHALHQAVVAWAATHLVLRASTPALQLFTLESRAKALSDLSTALATPTSTGTREAELACCLVLCSMDSIAGDTAGWDLHLQGAANMLRPALADSRHAMRPFLGSFDGRWLLRNFAYHDVLMSVTTDCAPLITGYYWRHDNDQDDDDKPHVADSYFGFASTLIFQISEISSLNAAMKAATIDETDFSQQAQALESSLLAWSCPKSSDGPLSALAAMYRSAALLHLYRVIYHHQPHLGRACHHRIQRQVDAIVNHMHSLPPESPPECTALFPIFMCGAETDRPHHTRMVRERLQSIMTSRNFKNIENAISVLDELWRRRFSVDVVSPLCNDLADWRDILQERGWKLALS